jgi:hypothetical protein
MIKPGKVCSQLVKANDTGETNIKVVGKYFRLTFVFNALKNSSKFKFNSSDFIFIFKIRGVHSIITCLEGGNLVHLTMHAP